MACKYVKCNRSTTIMITRKCSNKGHKCNPWTRVQANEMYSISGFQIIMSANYTCIIVLQIYYKILVSVWTHFHMLVALLTLRPIFTCESLFIQCHMILHSMVPHSQYFDMNNTFSLSFTIKILSICHI